MTRRLEVLPGSGTVMRRGGVAVWVGPSASASLLEFLDRSCRNLAPSPRGGRLLAAHVASVLAERDPEPSAPFACVGPDGDGGTAVLLHGGVQLWDGTSWHRPPTPPGWIQHRAPGTAVVVVGAAGAGPDPRSSHPLLDLETGVVPGSGFALVAEVPAPAPADDSAPGPVAPAAPVTPPGAPTQDARVVPAASAAPEASDVPAASDVPEASTAPGASSEPESTGAPEVPGATGPEQGVGPGSLTPLHGGEDPTVVLGAEHTTVLPAMAAPAATVPERPAPAAPRPAGVYPINAQGRIGASTPSGASPAVPVVRGVQCPGGHFNHPSSTLCARCGRPIERDRVVSGNRPPLGVLVVDDGSIWRLDRTYLLGGRPGSDPTVTGGTARALPVPGERVADAHAELRLGDWAVTLVDRGTQGGTWVLSPGGGTWERIEPYRQHLLRPGSHVAVGARVLTYLSAWPG